MKLIHSLAFGVLCCFVIVNGRQLEHKVIGEYSSSVQVGNDGHESHRHRRKRWNIGHGYHYPQPSLPFYEDRRDSYDNRHQEELLQIYKLLDEIMAYMRRPQMQYPQPVYIPYPYQVQVPQPCYCSTKNDSLPTINTRGPTMEDPNQNWGFEIPNTKVNEKDEKDDEDYEDDSIRPISFDTVKPKKPLGRSPPAIDRGTVQAGDSPDSPRIMGSKRAMATKISSTCEGAIILCCRPSLKNEQKQTCFSNYDCEDTYAGGTACHPRMVAAVIESYAKTYSPTGN